MDDFNLKPPVLDVDDAYKQVHLRERKCKITLMCLNVCLILVAICLVGYAINEHGRITSDLRLKRVPPADKSAFVSGSLFGVVAIFGFCAALSKRPFMLYFYISFLTLLILIEIAIMVLLCYIHIKLDPELRQFLDESIAEIVRESLISNTKNIKAWKKVDRFQRGFQCCGSNNYTGRILIPCHVT